MNRYFTLKIRSSHSKLYIKRYKGEGIGIVVMERTACHYRLYLSPSSWCKRERSSVFKTIRGNDSVRKKDGITFVTHSTVLKRLLVLPRESQSMISTSCQPQFSDLIMWGISIKIRYIELRRGHRLRSVFDSFLFSYPTPTLVKL